MSSTLSLDAVALATRNVRTENAEIARLCGLAGVPAQAAEFIGGGWPLHAVKAALQRHQTETATVRHTGTLSREQSNTDRLFVPAHGPRPLTNTGFDVAAIERAMNGRWRNALPQ